MYLKKIRKNINLPINIFQFKDKKMKRKFKIKDQKKIQFY